MVILVAVGLLAGCSGSESTDAPEAKGVVEQPVSVLVANSAGVVTLSGPQRVMVALLAQDGSGYEGGANTEVSFEVSFPDDGDLGATVPGVWRSPEGAPFGLYTFQYPFSAAGVWELIATSGGERLGSALLEVVGESPVPDVGEPVLPSETPTASTPEEALAISSDEEPDLAFYDLTIAEAASNDRPTLIAVVTPAFCQSQLCGPAMDSVKQAVEGRDELDVVHVEPFDLTEARADGVLVPTQTMLDWGLPTEPWVFVADADGVITARFEGLFTSEEIEEALDAL